MTYNRLQQISEYGQHALHNLSEQFHLAALSTMDSSIIEQSSTCISDLDHTDCHKSLASSLERLPPARLDKPRRGIFRGFIQLNTDQVHETKYTHISQSSKFTVLLAPSSLTHTRTKQFSLQTGNKKGCSVKEKQGARRRVPGTAIRGDRMKLGNMGRKI